MFDKLWLSQKYCTISSITCAFRFIAILFDRIFPRVKPIGKFTEVVHGLVISHLVVAAGLFFVFSFFFLVFVSLCLRVLFQSPDTQRWQNDYLQGTGCEMYTESLSPSFAGMVFPEASE